MHQPTSELSFKFRFVQNGYAQGLFSQKGIANERELVLGKEIVIYDDIADTTTRDNRIIMVLSPTACLSQNLAKSVVNNSALVLELYNTNAQKLEKYIDRISSAKEVEKHRQRLIAEGKANLFRAATCPECQATIDLSELERSAYIYCRFCESVFKEHQPAITKGANYRICDECQMFDRVRSYTEFYFYFLLVVYGFSSQRRHVCDNCANSLFWKTFWLNLLFVIGIIPSLIIKIKSMTGRDPYLKQLAKANSLSRKGKYLQAATIYNALHRQYLEHPGLLMDEGLGHLYGNDAAGALSCFSRSLRSCSNYAPVWQIMAKLQAAARQNQ